MTAVKALRMARATVNHDHSFLGPVDGDCHGCAPLSRFPDSPWPDVVDGHGAVGNMGSAEDWNVRCASALLDGFSVEEVTAAEHTTDQPHG